MEQTMDGYPLCTIYTYVRNPLLHFKINKRGDLITYFVWDKKHVEDGVQFYGRKDGPLARLPFNGTIRAKDMHALTGKWLSKERIPRTIRTRNRFAGGRAPRSGQKVHQSKNLRGRRAGVNLKPNTKLRDVVDYLLRVARSVLL